MAAEGVGGQKPLWEPGIPLFQTGALPRVGGREGGRALDPGKEALALGDGGKGGTVETEIEKVE